MGGNECGIVLVVLGSFRVQVGVHAWRVFGGEFVQWGGILRWLRVAASNLIEGGNYFGRDVPTSVPRPHIALRGPPGRQCSGDANGLLRPITCTSRKFNHAECNYPAHEREMLAFVHAIKTWKHYLMGMFTTAYTDSSFLKYISTMKSPSPEG